MKSLTFEVFGRQVVVAATDIGWAAYYLSADGKRRPATDIVVPPDIRDSEIEQYLDDLCHEWATAQHPGVKRLD